MDDIFSLLLPLVPTDWSRLQTAAAVFAFAPASRRPPSARPPPAANSRLLSASRPQSAARQQPPMIV